MFFGTIFLKKHDKSLMVMRKYQPHAKNIKPFLDEVLEWLKDWGEKANQDTNYQPIFIIDETFDTATEVDIKTVLNSYLVSNCHNPR